MLFKANLNIEAVSGKILIISPAKNKLPITKSGPNDGLPISLKLAANKKEPKNGVSNKDNIPIAFFEYSISFYHFSFFVLSGFVSTGNNIPVRAES